MQLVLRSLQLLYFCETKNSYVMHHSACATQQERGYPTRSHVSFARISGQRVRHPHIKTHKSSTFWFDSLCCRCTGNNYRGYRIPVKKTAGEEGYLYFTNAAVQTNQGLAGGLNDNSNAGAFCTSVYAVGLSVRNNDQTSNFWYVPAVLACHWRLMLIKSVTRFWVAVKCAHRPVQKGG
jgi:hypothetical protein